MPLDRPNAPLNSLGFAKSPQETRVVVAMSGGVDSSVVAAQLADEGYDVVGVTLQLYDHGAALAKKGACCAGRDIHDARRVAEDMGFPHYVLDYENIFKDAVIDEFADAYLAGATPVPCIRCNERVKFVPNGDYASVIEKLRPGAADPGDVVDMEGRVLGQHNGVIHYTIGQRRGLGIGGLSDPLYVVKLDPEARRVVVGPKKALATRHIPVREINWLGDTPFDSEKTREVAVKIRSTRPPRAALVHPTSPTTAMVELLTAEEGVSPGQA
ncbi:MAG: tRNA 2-thiouridine(34) synthase MnmA, partial [Rhodobacteraceae bacterium]|nr:tRNA 2-thiouridine(34) synthase MnmA [Paracoccaceae bacterium]